MAESDDEELKSRIRSHVTEGVEELRSKMEEWLNSGSPALRRRAEETLGLLSRSYSDAMQNPLAQLKSEMHRQLDARSSLPPSTEENPE